MMRENPLLAGVKEISRNWSWFLLLGVVLIVLGVVALGSTWLATLASILLFGWLLVLGGAIEVIAAIWARHSSGVLLHLLTGFLYVVVGILIISSPVAAAAGLTILLAALFLTRGIFRLISALVLRYPNWGWAAFDGVVTLTLGALVWDQWPASTLWVIGTFVGIDLLFRGWAWVMFAFGARKISRVAEKLSEAAA